jgi:hypothetical protein
MHTPAVRSIETYLEQLRAALEGADAGVIQEALALSAEFLRAEVAASPGRPEGDVLELIASTYGAPEDVAAIYQTGAEPDRPGTSLGPVVTGQWTCRNLQGAVPRGLGTA